MNVSIVKWLCLTIVVFIIFSAKILAQSTDLTLSNSKISIDFDRHSGELKKVKAINNLYTLIDNKKGKTSPWEISIDLEGKIQLINIYEARKFTSFNKGESYVLRWEGFPEKYKDLTVEVYIKVLPDSSMSAWNIKLEGISALLINKVRFPIINGLVPQLGEELAVPEWMGALLPDPRNYVTAGSEGLGWEYPGMMSMQLLSITKPGQWGTYFASNDTAAYAKTFRVIKDKDGNFGYAIDHFPTYEKGLSHYEPSYEVLFGGIQGDWLSAAQIYKSWAINQSWVKHSRLQNDQIPDWVKHTKYWVWNRGRANNVLDPAAKLNSKLGKGVSVLWHWWHQGSYDDSFPEYFPPRDGNEKFISSVKKAKKHDINAIVYMNALKWGPSTASWILEDVAPHSVKNIDGQPKSHVYNIFTNKALTYMCESSDFWKRKYASLIDTAINHYNVSGIYMDQTCLNTKCYDPSHGHTIGGGNYWMKEHVLKNDKIRSSFAKNDQIALAAEGVGENWLPYNDMFLALQVSRERYAGVNKWQVIPLFQSVYHEYGLTFGNYSSLLTPPYDEKWPSETAPKDTETLLNPEFNKQFIMEQARSFVWGMQPMIANYQPLLEKERKQEMEYMKNISKVRAQGIEYFVYGVYQRPLDLFIPETKVIISKLSIYAGQNEKVTRLEGMYPAVYTSTWKSAKNKIAFAFANIVDEPFEVHTKVKASDYQIANEGSIYLVDVKGRKKIGTYTNGVIVLNYKLLGRQVSFIEIVPSY